MPRQQTATVSPATNPQALARLVREAGGSRLRLFGIVGDDLDGFTDEQVAELLDEVDGPLTVELNSPGGELWAGLNIHNQLARMRPRIEVNGLAASMGSVIAMAGTTAMFRGSMMMIHNPWAASIGDAEEMRRNADRLDRIREAMVEVYMAKTGMGRDQLLEMLSDETWLTADEAQEMGFVDEVMEPGNEQPAARIAALDLSRLTADQIPTGLAAAIAQYSNTVGGAMRNVRAGPVLAGLLTDAVDAIDNDDDDSRSRSDVVDAMAEAAEISSSTVNSILNADIQCPPLARLEGFATVDGLPSTSAQRRAAEEDGCEYDTEGSTSACAATAQSTSRPAEAGQSPQNGGSTMSEKTTEASAQAEGKTDADIRAEERRKERERVAHIRKHCRVAGLTEDFANQLIESDVSAEAANEKILAAMQEQSASVEIDHHTRVVPGQDATEQFIQGATASLLSRAGVQRDDGQNNYRGYTLREMARMSLESRGVSTHGMSAMDVVGAAFTHSTSDFPAVLADTINKAMLQGWEETEETWQLWTRSGSLPDFKRADRVGLNLAPTLDKIPEGAEYSYGSVSDRSEPISLATYGKMLSITRQAIINDDLDAFSRIPRSMGQAARRTIGNLVYDVLTSNPQLSDGTPLFDADHNNLAGTGAAPSTDSFDQARTAMATQTDPDGHASALNISPAFVICPRALEGAVRTVLESERKVGGSGGSNNQTIPNGVRNMAQAVPEGRLDQASTTAYYFAASPSVHDTIEVAFLDGVDAPFLEQREGWNVDGTEFKVRIDAGVAPLDFRTFYKNPGA